MKKTNGTQYDHISTQYLHGVNESPDRWGLKDPSFDEHLGNVAGKVVFDLACGNGYYTRKLARAGARKVHGIDISKQMIEEAKKQDADLPNISYNVGDVAKFDFNKLKEQADVITAIFLLNYADSKDTLAELIENPARKLKSGGKFVAMLPHPELPIFDYPLQKTQEINGKPEEELKPGDVLRTHMTYGTDKTQTSFNFHWWPKEDYEHALRKAGFTNIIWHPVKPTKEAIAKVGKMVEPEINNPHMIILKATKI
ncbi:MAG: class I SAM-dependent methyltransferase [Candidatus Micrarchaeia archaeon]|jgi:SAM-dependent methyltransferase